MKLPALVLPDALPGHGAITSTASISSRWGTGGCGCQWEGWQQPPSEEVWQQPGNSEEKQKDKEEKKKEEEVGLK